MAEEEGNPVVLDLATLEAAISGGGGGGSNRTSRVKIADVRGCHTAMVKGQAGVPAQTSWKPEFHDWKIVWVYLPNIQFAITYDPAVSISNYTLVNSGTFNLDRGFYVAAFNGIVTGLEMPVWKGQTVYFSFPAAGYCVLGLRHVPPWLGPDSDFG